MQEIILTNHTNSEIHQQSLPPSRAELALADADQIGDKEASVLVRTVANAFDLTICEMFHHSRSRAPIAATRQLAMYMMHVVLGRSLTDVGRFFGRDRTTVSYACERVEDLRDDLEFDEQINQLENTYERQIAKQNAKQIADNKSKPEILSYGR